MFAGYWRSLALNVWNLIYFEDELADNHVDTALETEYAPDHAPVTLFKIAADHESPVDLDDFISLINVAISYLQHEKFQKSFTCTGGAFDIITTILLDSYTRFDSRPLIESSILENGSTKVLTSMRTALNQVLSDISALPEFKKACPISSSFSRTLHGWLLSTRQQIQLQVCACVMLGNLARLDSTCIEFVQTSKIHYALITILSEANFSQLLHAALGFLKNLAIPLENKKTLGEDGIFQALSRVWVLHTMPEVRFSSISLGRQLTIGTFENVRQIVQEVSSSTGSILSPLLVLFDSTDDEPIKMEIARLTTSMCRVLHSHTKYPQEEVDSVRNNIYRMHPEVSRQLSFVVSQKKWPVVRSEGWFVMALMARFSSGAEFVSNLLNYGHLSQALLELLTGKPIIGTHSPASNSSDPTVDTLDSLDLEPEPARPDAQATELVRLDHENALVLISEILKNYGSKMTVSRRIKFKELLEVGGVALHKSI